MSNPTDPTRSAVISMPSAAQLGGEGPVAWARFPFFPTAPWYSTNPQVGYQTRFYSTGILSTDVDFALNTEMLRTVQFDIPVRIIAINGAAFATAGTALNTTDMNLQYLFRVEHTSGDKLHTLPRIADTVVGRMTEPGEIGGHGYNVDQGGTLQVGITPLRTDIRIDITFVCLEMRSPRNFSLR